MGWITRNQAASRIGRALYGEPRTLSYTKLVELVSNGKIIGREQPTIGGRRIRHLIDEGSVVRLIQELTGKEDTDGRNREEGAVTTPSAAL